MFSEEKEWTVIGDWKNSDEKEDLEVDDAGNFSLRTNRYSRCYLFYLPDLLLNYVSSHLNYIQYFRIKKM